MRRQNLLYVITAIVMIILLLPSCYEQRYAFREKINVDKNKVSNAELLKNVITKKNPMPIIALDKVERNSVNEDNNNITSSIGKSPVNVVSSKEITKNIFKDTPKKSDYKISTKTNPAVRSYNNKFNAEPSGNNDVIKIVGLILTALVVIIGLIFAPLLILWVFLAMLGFALLWLIIAGIIVIIISLSN